MLAEPAITPLLAVESGAERSWAPPNAITKLIGRASPASSAAYVVQAYEKDRIWRAQTPQAAQGPFLLDAYERAAAEAFVGTDTASVLSHYGYQVTVLAASSDNPKLTIATDIPMVESLLEQRKA